MNLAALVRTGTPESEGRYVVFVRCASQQARDWVEPLIMTWAGGVWNTTYFGLRNIIGWIGPLPVMKVSDIEVQDFDL